MIQIVGAFTDDSRGIIYDDNIFIIQATGSVCIKFLTIV
jgi:hypothetical protein